MLIVCGSREMKLSTSITKAAKLPAGDALILSEFRSVISRYLCHLTEWKTLKRKSYPFTTMLVIGVFERTDKMEIYF